MVAASLALCHAAAHAQPADRGMPTLRKQGTATQLIVDGRPFLILGGELGNSTASSMADMRAKWGVLHALHLNTVIAPAYWELIEPVEGHFNFASVDSLIGDARRNDVRLVLLWFGSWKNSMSSYTPAWVKRNQARFPRTEPTAGKGQEMLAPFDSANWRADARAFGALMRHLRAIDGAKHTVIMVQVENEIGMIPEARDHSARADSLYHQSVPEALLTYLQTHRDSLVPEMRAKWDAHGNRMRGTWEEVFGADVYTEELFMAWWFARYTEQVAAAGKAAYPLPMNTNTALIRPQYLPGRYVSAGPLPHLFDVWKAAAPSLDILSPDIYFPNFTEWTDKYVRSGNPLFIPEATLGGASASNVMYAIGAHDAIGFSPFAIESVAEPAKHPIGRSYAMLAQLATLVLAHQGLGTMTAAIPTVYFNGTADATPRTVSLRGASYDATVSFLGPQRLPAGATPGADAPGSVPVVFGDAGRRDLASGSGAIVIAIAPDEFIIAGTGVSITFAPNGPGDPVAGILMAQTGTYVGGKWKPGASLNGDQTNQGRSVRIDAGAFDIQRVKLYRFH